jgi:hypothetical protein
MGRLQGFEVVVEDGAWPPDTLGVILAGGLAARLGPLGLVTNESLVMVGQQPLLITQIRALLTAGVRHIVIFTRFAWTHQLRELTARALSGLQSLRIDIVEDPAPTTGAAIALGRVLSSYPSPGPVIVLFAGSYLSVNSLKVGPGGDWVGVESAPTARNWCKWTGEHYIDGFADPGSEVAIGVFCFSQRELLCKLSAHNAHMGEAGLASLLNHYHASRKLRRVTFPGWRDYSDLSVVAANTHELIRTRPFNSITRASSTMLEKQSEHPEFRAEVRFLRKLNAQRARLFPRYEISGRNSYRLDYLDLPTLAQLYLYWPASPNHWSEILRTIIEVMKHEFWPTRLPGHRHRLVRGGEDMYIGKTYKRLKDWADPLATEDKLSINGVQHVSGEKLLQLLTPRLMQLVQNPIPAFLHGDLNFSNILYSLTTQTFKLLDPRGTWSEYGPVGDLRYDLAKLRYSYSGMLNAICDGLYIMNITGNRVTFDIGVERSAEILACDEVLGESADIRELRLIESVHMLSAPPLYGMPGDDDPRALYLRGVELANEVLDERAL